MSVLKELIIYYYATIVPHTIAITQLINVFSQCKKVIHVHCSCIKKRAPMDKKRAVSHRLVKQHRASAVVYRQSVSTSQRIDSPEKRRTHGGGDVEIFNKD